MAHYFLCMCLLRVALPICLTLSIIFRPSVLSAMYLLLLLYLPIVPIPTSSTMSGHTGCYLKMVICISFLTAISQLTFQIVLLSIPPYAYFLKDCEFLERILRHVGFIRLDGLSAKDVVQWLSPEIVMLFSSIVIYVLCNKLSVKRFENNPGAVNEEGDTDTNVVVLDSKPKKEKKFGFLIVLGRYIALGSLCIAGCLRPSVPNAFYFLIFLGGATWWACYKELRKAFAYVCRITLVVLFFHISALYAYQFQWPQEYLHPNSTYARYFGLTPIISVNCDDPRSIIFNDIEWASYLNPIWLLWLYYILSLESKLLLLPQLIRGVSPSRKYGVGQSRATVLQDSTGSVTIAGDAQDDIPMQPLEEELQSSLFENIVFALASIFQVLVRSSYIATNITMMAWSITYHCWLTFVLLLWANLLWLLPNQRRAMLRSAPFLVIYAEFLLLSAYVYGMNLTEDELPSKIQDINLAQIGFEKILILPCKSLIVKCLYTTMFWITLRQFMHERQEARQSSALADMVAPLEVTVGTATSAMTKEQESKGSQIMKTLGEYLKKFLTKFWIWIVAINLFVVAITGDRMTGFRIIYMFLFLVFILTFQLSYKLWRKIMYGFWVTVIGYSMLTLVLVYTYQFDNFPNYWTHYLHIPPEQQLDIGLERYETKQLFVRLLTPTFFVVITVIQLHYFHKDFLEISQIIPRTTTTTTTNASEVRPRLESDPRSEDSSAQGGPWGPESEKTDTETTERPRVSIKNLKDKNRLLIILKYVWHKLEKLMTYLWLYLEIHMFKIVLLIAMLLTVYDACAIHLIIMLLSVVAVTLGKRVQTIAIHLCSTIVSVMFLLRMVYQIKYIDHSTWDVHCDNTTVTIVNTTVYNNAEWLGFRKIDRGRDLPSLVKWYIGFILVVTIRAIILIRQEIWRIANGKPRERPYFLFPKISRTDADKNVKKCLMYLTNYGFYKFGVEVCFMATVALIGTRMDFYACLYGFWLCAMCMMSREKLSKIWNFYLAFIAFVLPLQYFMVVGLPPGLCMVYPWDIEGEDTRWRHMQDWMFLLDIKYPPQAHKLICDIFVLILVARQSLIFRVERRYENSETQYRGGSNKSIIHLAEDPNFVNPVPDFITYIRTWLDIFKRCVLLSFMWITLAIVFLAGTNRVNFFSLGYLIGSFIFLWQGSDLYLRPIPRILKAWNWLLGYNVAVIIVKTLLQIWGCIFFDDVNACWLMKLLGIGCIQKFGLSPLLPGSAQSSQCPPVPREDIGLAWDGLCFGFLIMQRRIFNSFNFFHVIDETKATTILASRGAELMEELREKQMGQQGEQERKILEKIKLKMDRIKATQQKIQGPHYKDASSHFVDTIFPRSSRPMMPSKVATSYKEAIRSGDYYMFDDLDDEELDLIVEKEDDESEDDIVLRAKSTTVGEDKESPRRGVGSVRIQEEDGTVDDPVPGSSKQQDDDDDEISLLSEILPDEDTKGRKMLNFLLFLWGFVESLMNTATNYLNRFSRDFRYVLRVLSKEKKLLKEHSNFRSGTRRLSTELWEPVGSFHSLVKQMRNSNRDSDSEESTDTTAPVSMGSLTPTDSYRRRAEAHLSARSRDGHAHRQRQEHDHNDDDHDHDHQPSSLDPIISYKNAGMYGTGEEYSHLPVGVGVDVDIMVDYETAEMSSVDQPSVIRLMHAIWFAILSHSDFVCYVMIFLNQIKSASVLSLPLPLMVFLWGTLTIPRPSKTFWITIIAYTEVIVLIKCIFQFQILEDTPQVNNPFHPPRILGIERTSNYATYDLLLLLIVFFHRLMLKTLGLWKSSYEPQECLSEGIYKVDSEDEDTSSATKDKMKKSSNILDVTNLSIVKEKQHMETELTEEEMSNKSLVRLNTEEISPLAAMPTTIKLATKKYMDTVKQFFKQLLDPTSRITVDVYAYMFMCDFINFMVVIFGFAAFGTQQGDGGVSAYLQENKVPIPFLLMLILQFVLIIVDRGLFLRKYILGKIIFQFLQIIGVHIWMFFVLPAVTERSFNALLPPKIWYMVKCFYLLLSAYQIRCGYPTRILGNFLCKGYNYVNMILFKFFMAVPFLFELRTIMDWMWTDTSMTIFDWLKMEDIFATIFQLKCSRHVETEYPQPRGEKKKVLIKYLMGGAGLFAIVAVIWFPLVFFALGSTVGDANIPYDVTLNLRIGPYQPVYSMSAQTNAIFRFSEADYAILNNNYKKDRVALTFLSSYEHEDVAAVKLNGNSTMVWGISPPDIDRMLEEVDSDKDIVLRLRYIISRVSNNKQDSGIIASESSVKMPAKINNKPNPDRVNLALMLRGSEQIKPILIQRIFPKFVKVTNRAIATPVTQLLNSDYDDEHNSMRNITLRLSRTAGNSNQSSQMWWELKEDCSDINYKTIKNVPYSNCEYLLMYTFNEKSFPASLSFLSGGGIIGLYTTLVFVASRMIRGIFSEICFKIMFDDMPNVDRVLQLCLDIYLVREARELCLEEDLFAKLVFLFRSPETLIKWTRPKEEEDEEDDDDENVPDAAVAAPPPRLQLQQ